MNILKKIRTRYILSRKSTFRIIIEENEYNKEIREYYYKILPKRGFIKSKINGKFTYWCNPDRITNIEFKNREEFYADDSPTIKVCEECLEKKQTVKDINIF